MESWLWPQKCSINSLLVAIKYYLLKHLNFTPNLCLDLDVNTFPQDNSSKKVDKKFSWLGLIKNPFGWLCIRNIKQAAMKGRYITIRKCPRSKCVFPCFS